MYSCYMCSAKIEDPSSDQIRSFNRTNKTRMYCSKKCSSKYKKEVNLNRLVNKSISSDIKRNKSQSEAIFMRMPKDITKKIDNHIGKSLMRVSRNQWILYAIEKTLILEGENGKS